VNRDRADLRGLGTDFSLVRLARNIWALAWARAVKRALAANVNVHGPAAWSLTIAATTGGVSKNKRLSGYPSKAVWFWSRRRRPVPGEVV
jgi:hypothetical protein